MVFQEAAGAFLKRLITSKKPQKTDALRRVNPAPDHVEAASLPAAPERVLTRPKTLPERAQFGQDNQRNRLHVEKMAAEYIRDLKGGHYAYRVIKSDFDKRCELVAVDPVSDHLFARWLTANKCRKYRASGPDKITMYQVPRRPSARVSRGEEMRC